MTGSFNEKSMFNMPSFKEKGHGKYTSSLKTRIMETLPSVAKNFESITVNIAFCCPWFQISYESIGLIMTV